MHVRSRVPRLTDILCLQRVLAFHGAVEEALVEYIDLLEAVSIKDGLRVAMKISSLGNEFLQHCQPWVVLKTDKVHCAMRPGPKPPDNTP